MVFFKDPLPHRNPNLDLQGLSDWHKAYVPDAKVKALSLLWPRQHLEYKYI